MRNFKTVQEARAFLTEQGFYTDILWRVEDVQSRFECTDDEAQEVLDGALQNDSTMEQIWFAIDFHAKEQGLTEIED